jgi:hypothetical protein
MMLINTKSCKDFLLRSKEVGFAHLALMYPIFFPTIKSWGNALSFVMLIFALIHLIGGKDQYFFSRSKTFWFALIALTSPFFLELIVQVFRGPFTWNTLDGPSRFLIGGVIFVYLSKHRDIDSVVMSFCLGCLISLPVTFFYVLIFDNFYWDGRCATQILCPNALPVYVLAQGICGICYLYSSSLLSYKKAITIAIVSSFVFYILLICETRTVWVSLLCIVPLSIVLITKKVKIKMFLMFCIFLSSILIAYFTSPIIKQRLSVTAANFTNLVTKINEPKSLNSSLGSRFGLFLFDFYLGTKNNFLGYPDGVLPPLSEVSNDIPFMTDKVYFIKSTSGSHCEYTAHLSRKGLIFGFLTILSIFIYPLFYIFRIIFIDKQKNIYLFASFLTILSMCICALGVQVFGLKMSSSFWAIFLALFYSYILRLSRAKS